MYLAIDYLEAGEFEKARDFCRALIAENDEMTGAYILLGDAERRLGNVDEALKRYENAAALEPQNDVLQAKIAGLLVEIGESDRARAILERLETHEGVVRSPEYATAVSALAMSLLAGGETGRALELYRKAVELDSRSAAALVNLGSAYFSLGRYDEALENFEKALSLDKTFALAWSNAGLAHLARFQEAGDSTLVDQALREFEKALALQPGLAAAYNGRASAELLLDRTAEAVRDYEKAIRLDPDLGDAYVNLGIALREVGRYDEALKYLDEYKRKFYAFLAPVDRESVDQMIAEVKTLRDGR